MVLESGSPPPCSRVGPVSLGPVLILEQACPPEAEPGLRSLACSAFGVRVPPAAAEPGALAERLLHRDAFRQVSRLIHVGPA